VLNARVPQGAHSELIFSRQLQRAIIDVGEKETFVCSFGDLGCRLL
jgi:hypothetical protein